MSSLRVLEEFFGEDRHSILFTSRPEAIPGDLRISWRLSAICLILDKFRSQKSQLDQLHIMWWAIRADESRKMFLRWFSDNKRPDEAIVRFDPSLSSTVDLALGQGLVVQQRSGSIALTGAGKALARRVRETKGVFLEEKDFLNQIPGKLTQRAVKDVPEWN
ncbi:hypothetical protein [Nocardia sp. NBC_00416]|uniref:hypothetical protein n=1 Tax=Nocardia sp. NBC_00416 TaxID=2975991 RepID=UPI002E216905